LWPRWPNSKPPSRRTLVLSVSHDKDVAGIVRELVPHFDRVVVTQYQENPRAVAVDVLAKLAREAIGDREVAIHADPRMAWEHVCRSAEPGELVCIAGSFYLAAEMRPMVTARQDAAAI
jgi:dihydrofolate synthase/folylpolyglutamate synthase